jgi:hypothetical protein
MVESVSLPVLLCLEAIVSALIKDGPTLTKTTLCRYHDCDLPEIDEALDYGSSEDIIKWGLHNKITILNKQWKIPERSYYRPCLASLQLHFKSDFSKSNGDFFIEDTSSKDSKISGRWTRPDLTMVSHKTYSYTIGHEFDVWTFEIKRPEDANVLAVFEALSHATAATRPHVVFPMNFKDWRKIYSEHADRVMDECSRHGVGLIFVDDFSGNGRVNFKIEARRRDIDHERSGAFLEAVLSSDALKKIAGWKR